MLTGSGYQRTASQFASQKRSEIEGQIVIEGESSKNRY